MDIVGRLIFGNFCDKQHPNLKLQVDQPIFAFRRIMKNSMIHFKTTLMFLEVNDGLHRLLHPAELHFMFGTSDHDKVSQEEYQVVVLRFILF